MILEHQEWDFAEFDREGIGETMHGELIFILGAHEE